MAEAIAAIWEAIWSGFDEPGSELLRVAGAIILEIEQGIVVDMGFEIARIVIGTQRIELEFVRMEYPILEIADTEFQISETAMQRLNLNSRQWNQMIRTRKSDD